MIYLNLGRRFTGKTTLGLYLIEKCPYQIVFDPRGLVPTDDRVRSPIRFGLAMDDWAERDPTPQRIVFTPEEDVTGSFRHLARGLKNWVKDDQPKIGCLIDEIRFIDDLERVPAFDWTLRCSAEGQAVIVLTAHRPSDVPVDIRAIADVWCIFQVTQEHDLKVIRERCSETVATIASRLGPREFVTWNDAGGTFEVFKRPADWYRPLQRSARPAPDADRLGELTSEAVPGSSRLFP